MANKTMHHVVVDSDTYEIVDQYAREHGASIALDTTLTEAGKAADAKAVGDAIAAIEGGGGSVIVDPTLSSTSTHPVQNKAIYEAIENAAADIAKAQSLMGMTELTSADYNTLTTVGEYYVLAANVGNISNKPVNARQRITVESTLGSGTTYIRQTVRAYNSEDVYVRHSSNSGSSWSAWSRMTADNATTSTAGLMSAQDKSRLDDLYSDYSSALVAMGLGGS